MKEVFEKMAIKFAQQERRNHSTRQNQLALWIGRIVIAFNELDVRLAQEIAAELGHNTVPVQDMMQSCMSFGQKLDIFSALLVERFRGNDSHLTYIQTVLRTLSAAEDCRNAVVHSSWSTPPVFSGGFERRKVRAKGRKGVKVDHVAANIAGLRAAAGDIQVLQSIATIAMRFVGAAERYNQEAFTAAGDRLRAACQSPRSKGSSLRAFSVF